MTANPLFTTLDQPRIGEYLAPGLPICIDGSYPPATPSPALGDHTAQVLGRLGLSAAEIDKLTGAGTIA